MQRHRALRVVAWLAIVLTASGTFGGDPLAPVRATDLPAVAARTPTEPAGHKQITPSSAPTSSTVTVETIPADARCPQWWDRARHVGWDDDALLRLDVVMHRESRCRPDVFNADDPHGGSRGLLQINGSWTRWLRERGILRSRDELFDPDVNLTAALAIYHYGIERYDFGWGPWGYRYKDPYPVAK